MLKKTIWHYFLNNKDNRIKFHVLQIYFSKYIFLACVCFFIIFVSRFFIISPGTVNGKSMEPTYLDNNLFLVNKFIYLLHPPHRYDVAQIIDTKEDKLIIKRIIGLPGEIVIIKRGRIYIQKDNNSPEVLLDELNYLSPNTYTQVHMQKGVAKFFVGSGQYFVVGDNRRNSVDSRFYGPILRSKIIGKVIEFKND